MARLLTRTSLKGLRPVGAENRRAHEAYEFLRNYVEQTLGPGSGGFLSEPVEDGDGVLWYVDSDAPATPLSQLPQDRQERLLGLARKQIDALTAASDGLAQSRNPDQARMGEMLRAAMQTGPSGDGAADLLYEVDGRPVLVGWGLREDVPNPPEAPLVTYLSEKQARLRQPPPPPPPSAPPAAPPPRIEREVVVRYDWLTPALWALFIALMIAIYLLLFAACGLGSAGGLFSYCSATARAEGGQAELAALVDEGAALQAALEQARARGDRIQACAPAPGASPGPIEAAAPPPDPTIEQRREAAGGETGDVTITLIWNDPADLDLHLLCPNGQKIFYGDKNECGGRLDIDANAGQEVLAAPIENIQLSAADAPSGPYTIRINNFAAGKSRVRPTPFIVQVAFRDSGTARRYEGVVDEERTVDVTTFTLP